MSNIINNDNNIISPFIENIHSYNGMQHTRYTTSIRNIVFDYFKWNDETKYDGYALPEDVIEKGRELVFNFKYPIIDKNYSSEFFGDINTKELFETAFINKYITDEIGFESFAEFQMKLRGKLFEVIPLYNTKINLFMNMKLNQMWGGYTLTEQTDNTHKDSGNSSGTDNSNVTNNGTSKNIGSTFPVNYVDDYDNLDGINYGTDGNSATSNNKSDRKNNTTGKFDNNGEFHTTHTVDRKDLPDISKLTQLSNIFSNILTGTLKEFDGLFMGIF